MTVVETPAPAQDLAVPTPVAALERERMTLDEHFRRDHFPVPDACPDGWEIEVGGLVRQPLHVPVGELRRMAAMTQRVVLECAGHRRNEQQPPVSGIPWGVGAVGELDWTGVPLHMLLRRAGVLPGARFVVLEGADRGPVADGSEAVPFGRALPLARALHPDTLLAYEAAGEPLPVRRGGPVRAIVPGWYATDSVKWLERITVTDEPYDGYFEAVDYRIADFGDPGLGERMTEMGVHALLTSPARGIRLAPGRLELRGVAWGGCGVAEVEVAIDGIPWRPATLGPSRGRYARRFWSYEWDAEPGLHLVEVRATDLARARQPAVHRPNRRGYGNHSRHRVPLRVG